MSYTTTIWACVDCLMTEANGEPHPDIEAFTAGMGEPGSITLGLTHDAHADDCDADTECECDKTTFSWSPCDICGSPLGGSRHAFTVDSQ